MLAEASEALEILHEELDSRADPARGRAVAHVVLGLLFVRLAAARGVFEGESERLADSSDPWRTTLDWFGGLHHARGGWLFAPRRFATLAEHEVSATAMRAVFDRLSTYANADVEILGAVYEVSRSVATRRRTSAHYTPRTLADAIVATTLAPLLRTRPAESLTVCDPAMGSGAFVLAACRALGARIDHPRGQLIAGLCCVFGVDEDPTAVALAKLSLWLETRATDSCFDCFDHTLRCGDALVGLELDGLRRLDWSLASTKQPPSRRVAPHRRCTGVPGAAPSLARSPDARSKPRCDRAQHEDLGEPAARDGSTTRAW